MNFKNKVIFIVSSLHIGGGTERVVLEHIKICSEKFVCLLLIGSSKQFFYEKPKNVKISVTGLYLKQDMKSYASRFICTICFLFESALRLPRILKANEAHQATIYCASPIQLLAIFLSGFPLKNVAVSEHSAWNGYNIFYRLIILLLYPQCKCILVPSTSESKRLSKFCKNISYLPNLFSFVSTSASLTSVAIKPGLSSQNSRYVLAVGRLTRVKNYEFILNTWHKALKMIPNDISLTIVGSGELHFKLLRQCELLNIESRVHFVGDTNAIHEYYISSMFLVHASISEGFSLVIAESLRMSKPVIAFDCDSGPRDLILGFYNGFLIPELDEYAFLKKIVLLCNNEKLLRDLSANCIKSIPHISYFNCATILKELLS